MIYLTLKALADDAVSSNRSPQVQFPGNREKTGNIAQKRLLGQKSTALSLRHINDLMRKFPARANREFSLPNSEEKRAKQGVIERAMGIRRGAFARASCKT